MVVKLATCIYIRAGSTRLPEKCYRIISGKIILEHIVHALTARIDRKDIWLLTSVETKDDRIVDIASSLGINTFRGSEEFPILRTTEALPILLQRGYTHLARVCGDSPVYSLDIQCEVLKAIETRGVEWSGGNTLPKSFPNGMSVEIYCLHALAIALKHQPELLQTDSLTEVMKRINPRINLLTKQDIGNLGCFTVDTLNDIEKVSSYLGSNRKDLDAKIKQMLSCSEIS